MIRVFGDDVDYLALFQTDIPDTVSNLIESVRAAEIDTTDYEKIKSDIE